MKLCNYDKHSSFIFHLELQDNVQQKEQRTDEEKIRIKSERDFFQKEYLRLISKAGSEKVHQK